MTAIVEQDTDLTLSGDYYHYEEDPTQVGFFSVATAGRTLVTGGNGVPIAPLRYLLRPEVVHRFGDFSAKLWVTTGRYVTWARHSATHGQTLSPFAQLTWKSLETVELSPGVRYSHVTKDSWKLSGFGRNACSSPSAPLHCLQLRRQIKRVGFRYSGAGPTSWAGSSACSAL